MALYIQIRVGINTIKTYFARRTMDFKSEKSIHIYEYGEVTHDEGHVVHGTLQHRYDDGATILSSKVLNKMIKVNE